MVHEGSSRKRADVKRDGQLGAFSPETYSREYALRAERCELPVAAAYPRLQQKLHESCGLGPAHRGGLLAVGIDVFISDVG